MTMNKHMIASFVRIGFCHVALLLAYGCQDVPVRAEDPGREATYGRLYSSRFDRLALPDPEIVKGVSVHEVYPVPIRQFWDACLDVVWQYDVVGKMDSNRHMVMFGHGVSLPTKKSRTGRPFEYVNVLLIVLAETRGEMGTDLYVCWLPPESLEVTSIESATDEDLGTVKSGTIREVRNIVAGLVTRQFMSQLSTQLFGPEKWMQRLELRHVSLGKNE